MKKILIFLALLLIAGGTFVALNSKDKHDTTKDFVKYSKDSIEFNLPDQFDKMHQVKDDTKFIMIAFSKEDGHTIRGYLKSHKPTLLEERHGIFIADISKVPTVIRNMVILKDFKKSKFPVVIIYDKKISETLNDNKGKILVLHLQNKKIVKVDHIKTVQEVDKLFN